MNTPPHAHSARTDPQVRFGEHEPGTYTPDREAWLVQEDMARNGAGTLCFGGGTRAHAT